LTVEFHQPLRGILDQLAQKIVRRAYAAASAATVTSHHRSWRSRPEGRSFGMVLEPMATHASLSVIVLSFVVVGL